MRVVAIGRTQFLLDSISKISTNHQIVMVIHCKESDESTVSGNDFKNLSKNLGSYFLETDDINSIDIVKKIKDLKADIGISINWKFLIKKEVINCFEHGILNAHLGDLPRFRGNATPNWAIINGEEKIVLTIHKMSEELDAGPIISKKDFILDGQTYIEDVYNFFGENCSLLFYESLNNIVNGKIKEKPQSTNPADILRCFPRIPEYSQIDWSQKADEICRLIRASSRPFKGAFTFFNDKKLIIWKARVENPPYNYLGKNGSIAYVNSNGEVAVVSKNGFLVLEEVEYEGQVCQASNLIKSTRCCLGLDIC